MENQEYGQKMLWEELCYILRQNIKQNIDESAYQREIIRAFEKLGWSQFKGEIIEKPPLQIGSSQSIYPDIIIKLSQDSQALFVVEVKKPSVDLNSYHANQLLSYMRQIKCELGLLIGNMIQIYWDNRQHGSLDLVCLEKIQFKTSDVDEGIKFTHAFRRDSTGNLDILKEYIQSKLQKIEDRKNEKELHVMLSSVEYKQKILNFIRNDITSEYGESLCNKIINQITINISIGNNSYKIPVPTAAENKFNSLDNIESMAETDTSGSSRDNTKYIFFGQEYKKNRLALAIVRKYVNENPNVNFSELERVFPKHIFKGHHQGSNGVFADINTIRNSGNRDMLKRFFIKPDELINLADAIVAVSNQWGLANINLLIQIASKLDYQIKPTAK